MTAQEAITQVRTHRPLAIQNARQHNFIRAFEQFTLDLSQIYASQALQHTLSKQRKYLHGQEQIDLRHVPKIVHVVCTRLVELYATTPSQQDQSTTQQSTEKVETPTQQQTTTTGERDAFLRFITEGEKTEADNIQIEKYKREVDAGAWIGITQCASGTVILCMLVDWLALMSPPLLHEAEQEILDGRNFEAAVSLLSESTRKTLKVLVHNIRKLHDTIQQQKQQQKEQHKAQQEQEQQQKEQQEQQHNKGEKEKEKQTLYSLFAKVLVTPSKSDQQLALVTSFLTEVSL